MTDKGRGPAPGAQKGRVTLRDVARAAGVSPALVSFAMNDREGVAAPTRLHILETARRLGYIPDPVAQELRTGRSNVYGLIVRNIRNPFFVDLISGAQEAAMKSGSALVVMDSGYSAHREQLFIEQLAGRRVGGLAISPVGPGDAVQKWKLLRPDTPVVIINAAGDFGENATRVAPDNALAIRLAVKHLHDLGHRRITLLTARAGEVADHDRLVYFHSYCEKFGIHPEPFEVALEFDHIRLGVKELLAGKRPPTAIITNSDYAACAVYQAARESSVEVGSGLSVVGHDDLLTSQLLDPPLTTIRLDRRAMGAAILRATQCD